MSQFTHLQDRLSVNITDSNTRCPVYGYNKIKCNNLRSD